MDELKEYDLDALSYIDQEYDNPMVKEYVDSLVRAEMSTFSRSSKNYLAHLPYPSLKFVNSESLRAEWDRVKASKPFKKLDMKRYSVEPPPTAMENDAQAWRSSVTNAKVQLEHQMNRLLNLELVEKYGSDVWIYNNTILEKYDTVLNTKNEQIFQEIQKINNDRKMKQEKIKLEYQKLSKRRDESILKSWQIAIACTQLKQLLPTTNNDDDSHLIISASRDITNNSNIDMIDDNQDKDVQDSKRMKISD